MRDLHDPLRASLVDEQCGLVAFAVEVRGHGAAEAEQLADGGRDGVVVESRCRIGDQIAQHQVSIRFIFDMR